MPTPTPHDALFKAVFGQPEHARGALRAVLPSAITEALDWDTLAHQPGSFVDQDLVERHTDLVFSAALHAGGRALVYIVFEHQSTPDDSMAFRLVRYIVRLWERWRAEHPEDKLLPAVIPVVLYHGDKPWSAALGIDAILDVPAGQRAAIAPHTIQLTYSLDDLSAIPDGQLRRRAMTALGRLSEVCFKYARTRTDLLDILTTWADVVRDVVRAPDGLEAIGLVMRYIAHVNNHVEPEALIAFVEREAPEAKEVIMTVAEKLIQQGEARGQRDVLLRQLRKRFGSQVDVAAEQRVLAGSPEQIDLWIERILTAATVSDVLAS